ncbi:MAG: DUF302 domain-containing protein [Deltaproteobacteria bacterium]|nr:DUF302 domain-containing protein [Deltaproteobacteria bacterium]
METVQQNSTPPDPGYGLTAHIAGVDLATAREAIIDTLKEEGFGILTEIDVTATLQKKIGVNFRPYTILGACNPQLAHRALTAELAIGLLLPCNVCVWEEEAGAVISIASPATMFRVTGRDDVEPLAAEAEERLHRALDKAHSLLAQRA